MKVSLSVSARFLLFWAFILFAGSFVAAAPRWPFSAAEEPQKAAAEPEPPRLSPHEGNPIPPSHFNAKTIPKELRAQFYHELGLPSREWMRPEEMVDDKGKVKLVGRIGGRFDPSQEKAFLKEHGWVHDEL